MRRNWHLLQLGMEEREKNPGSEALAPPWLVDLIGVDYLGHVAAVELPWNEKVGDSVVEQVARLHQLEKLNIQFFRLC